MSRGLGTAESDFQVLARSLLVRAGLPEAPPPTTKPDLMFIDRNGLVINVADLKLVTKEAGPLLDLSRSPLDLPSKEARQYRLDPGRLGPDDLERFNETRFMSSASNSFLAANPWWNDDLMTQVALRFTKLHGALHVPVSGAEFESVLVAAAMGSGRAAALPRRRNHPGHDVKVEEQFYSLKSASDKVDSNRVNRFKLTHGTRPERMGKQAFNEYLMQSDYGETLHDHVDDYADGILYWQIVNRGDQVGYRLFWLRRDVFAGLKQLRSGSQFVQGRRRLSHVWRVAMMPDGPLATKTVNWRTPCYYQLTFNAKSGVTTISNIAESCYERVAEWHVPLTSLPYQREDE